MDCVEGSCSPDSNWDWQRQENAFFYSRSFHPNSLSLLWSSKQAHKTQLKPLTDSTQSPHTPPVSGVNTSACVWLIIGCFSGHNYWRRKLCDCAFCFWDWRAGCMVPDLCLSAQCWDKLLRCNSKNLKQQRPEYLDFFFIRGMSQAPKTLEPTFPIRQLKLWGPWFYSTWWMNTCYHPGKGNNIQLSIWEDTWVNMLNCSSTQSDETSSSQPQIQPTHLTSNCNTINVVLLQFPWSCFMVQCEKPTWMTVVAIKTKPVSQALATSPFV